MSVVLLLAAAAVVIAFIRFLQKSPFTGRSTLSSEAGINPNLSRQHLLYSLIARWVEPFHQPKSRLVKWVDPTCVHIPRLVNTSYASSISFRVFAFITFELFEITKVFT